MEQVINHNETADREIVITRLLNAPRELVFKAWTDPKHLIKWWGCKDFTNTFHEIDIRPGGIWRFTMHAPNGMDFLNVVTYKEIVEPEKLVYEHGSGEENDEAKFNVIITFEDQDGKTRITMRSLFVSSAIRDMVIREFGAIEGGNQTLDRLEQELLTM